MAHKFGTTHLIETPCMPRVHKAELLEIACCRALPSCAGNATKEALLDTYDGRALADRLAANESRCARFVSTLAFEKLQSNCNAVFRHLIACLTRPTEHVRTHVGEHDALCAALWQLRS